MNDTSRWLDLLKQIKKRTVDPIYHPSFVFFFLIAIVIIGASGVWNEIVNLVTAASGSSPDTLRKSIMSYFPVLAASTCLQIIWEDRLKPVRTFIISLFVLTLIGLYICANENIGSCKAIIFGVLASLISMWMWWMANADQKYLQDPVIFTAPTGNENPDDELQGSLTSFKH